VSRIAFLFPGQGSQAVGMGKALAERYPEAREVFERADVVLGFALSTLCFGGPLEDLTRTENTQPALLVVSVAAARVLERRGVRASAGAGHKWRASRVGRCCQRACPSLSRKATRS
jgi:[acyl-carrier-protein] S-malonyltransferase